MRRCRTPRNLHIPARQRAPAAPRCHGGESSLVIPAESGTRAGAWVATCPIGLTVLLAVAFLTVLTLIFATIDPRA